MGLFSKDSISRDELEKVLKAQEIKMRAAYWDREKKLIREYEDRIKEIREDHSKNISKIYEDHEAKIRSLNSRKMQVTKEIMEEKDETIRKLEKENIDLLKRTRRYREAYELYRDNRNKVLELAHEMGSISDRVMMTSAKMNSFFAQLSDFAEANVRAGLALDPKIEALMYVDEQPHDETHLRLIESKLEKAE